MSEQPPIKQEPEFTPQQLVKMLLELGPLVVFFIVNSQVGIFWGTGWFMVATTIALAASWRIVGRIPLMPLVSGACILVFGGLTFWLDDPSFIKMKPTFINLLFAGVLGAGLLMGRPLLKLLLGEAFNLTQEGWRKLTVRWIVFFLVVAVLNEVVWRNTTETVWVNFKVFGILPLTLVFAMAQIGLIRRYEAKTPA